MGRRWVSDHPGLATPVEVGREDAQVLRRADEAQTARLRHPDGEIGEGGAAHLCIYWASLAGIL